MDLMSVLAQILNPQGGQPMNRLTQSPRMEEANYLTQAGAGAAPMGMPQMAAQPVPQQSAPQQPAMAQSAPAPSPAPSGGGIGGFLSNIFGGGQNAGKNQTIQYLMQQGMDEGTATMYASSKPALQQYLLSRSKGKEYDFVTGRDGSIFRADKQSGTLDQVYGGKPDHPADVQEYEYAKSQGYPGTFQEFTIEQKRAGASQVNIDQKSEGAFDKKVAENQATMFTEMATGGLNAKADIAVLGELEGLLGQTGGTLSGVSGILAKYGIGGEGMGDLQAAQALLNKLVPTQRQPGSGTMSDADLELFKRSLPSLWNTPGGNEKILHVMRGLAQYKQMQGEIASQVLNGQMSRQDATKALQAIPNPLEGFKTGGGDVSTMPPPEGIDPKVWEHVPPEKRKLWQ